MTSCIAKARLAAGFALGCLLGPAMGGDFTAERAKLQAAAPKDVVLHTLQTGVAAMGEGKTAEATALFDNALVSIETMFADNANAAKARSLWYEEGAKDYKGEPYERAMAFWYRGLLYLAEGDYENARASFRGGVLQDAFAEEQQHRSDFASLMLLEGWANQVNGDAGQAADAYAEVARLRPGWTAPPKGANTLIVAELGGSPRKVGDGVGNHEIVYRRPKRTPEKKVQLKIGETAVAVAPVEDLYFQAASRGGRPIDRLINGKVQFQNVASTVGDVLGTIASEGSVLQSATGGGHGRALGAIAAVGAIASIISANVKPRADVRYWANLPETLHVTAISAAQAPQAIAAMLTDENGNAVPVESLQIQQWRDKRGNGLIWIKTRN